MTLLAINARLEERFSGVLGAVHGLGLNEALLLIQLDRAEKHRLSRVELARRLSTSPSTVTRMAQPLEKLGYIDRESDPRDARLAYVLLTDIGRERVADAKATLTRLADEVFRDRWSAQDVTTLAELLGRLTAGQPGDLSQDCP